MHFGSVTRAAQNLGSSQPTVSRELSQLERKLSLQLFERRQGRLFPTAEAMLLFEEVKRSYVGLERIAAAADALREKAGGLLSVACLPTFAETLLPRALEKLRARHPTASVSITALESPFLESWLTEQRVDLGIVERSKAPPATELIPLLTADEVCVLPAGHPLLKRRSLRLRDFAGQPFVSFAPDDPYRTVIDQLFAAHGIERTLPVDTTSAASACALVERGLGLSLVNPLTALQRAGDKLHVRPVTFSVPFHVSLIRTPHRVRHPLEVALVEALQAGVSSLQRELRAITKR